MLEWSLFHRKSFLVWRTLWESLETSLVLLPGQDFLRRMLQLLMWGISLDQEVPRRWRAALQEMKWKQRKQMTTRQGWSTWETLTLRSPEVPTFLSYFWSKYTFLLWWQTTKVIKNLLGIYASLVSSLWLTSDDYWPLNRVYNEWPWVMREFLPRSRYICPAALTHR